MKIQVLTALGAKTDPLTVEVQSPAIEFTSPRRIQTGQSDPERLHIYGRNLVGSGESEPFVEWRGRRVELSGKRSDDRVTIELERSLVGEPDEAVLRVTSRAGVQSEADRVMVTGTD